MAGVKGEWTEGRYRSFITSVIRGGFRRWPNKYIAIKQAYIGKKLNESSGRPAMHYQCAICNEEFPAAQIQVDHIDPVVDPATGFTSWDSFIERLFCSADNLQVVCKPCHKIKTQEEKQQRKRK
jgi:5-methylcytosine-specific restriction endonuclease McrA